MRTRVKLLLVFAVIGIFVFTPLLMWIHRSIVRHENVPGNQAQELGKMTVTLASLDVSGNRASYLVAVDATGAANVQPAAGGAAQTGSAIGVIQFSDVSIFVLNNAESSVALLYEAALGREPDAAGLTNWINIYNNLPSSVQSAGVYSALAETSGGYNGSLSIADGFIQSTEFQSKYGALDTAGYVTQLYANVLHRTPDSGGMTTWMTALTLVGQSYVDANSVSHAGQGESRAYVLVGFAESNENIADCAASSTTSGTAGWLINTNEGGYVDPTVYLSTTTVVNQAVTNANLNTGLIDPSSITTVMGNPSFSLKPDARGGFDAGVSDPGATVELSSGINVADVNASGVTVKTASGGGSLIDVGIGSSTTISNTTVDMTGSGNVLQMEHNTPYAPGDPQSVTVNDYVPGSDGLAFAQVDLLTTQIAHIPVTIITSGNGTTLNFTQSAYALNVGSVGNGSATSVAAAANAVYVVGDVNGNTSQVGFDNSYAGENLLIFGQTSSGDTVIYEWAKWGKAPNGLYLPIFTADSTGQHTIEAAELLPLVTLVGVHASSLTAADFH